MNVRSIVEPIADSEIKRVLVVTAHPDDSDFGASGTLAKWIKAGIMVIKAEKSPESPLRKCPLCANVNKEPPVKQLALQI